MENGKYVGGNNGGEQFIPGSDPNWKLPEEHLNSLVTEDGTNWDNGYSFDERDDEGDNDKARNRTIGFNAIEKERELAEYAKNQTLYTGLFINPETIYNTFPPRVTT